MTAIGPRRAIIDGCLFWADGSGAIGRMAPDLSVSPPTQEKLRDRYLRGLIEIEEFEEQVEWLLRFDEPDLAAPSYAEGLVSRDLDAAIALREEQWPH